MNARTFLDTNVFIYSFDQSSRSKARRAISVIREAIDSRKGVVSFQVVQSDSDVLLTEDLQGGQKFGTLVVRNPFI